MSPEHPPGGSIPSFEQYKALHEGSYSADHLSHYFNNELGIVSNMISTLHHQLITSPIDAKSLEGTLEEIERRLVVAHEIANLGFSALITSEDSAKT